MATREENEFDVRFMAVTTGVIDQHEPGSSDRRFTIDMSKDYYRLDGIVHHWAVRTYGDHVNADDVDALDELSGEVFDFIRAKTVAWAEAQRARVRDRVERNEARAREIIAAGKAARA